LGFFAFYVLGGIQLISRVVLVNPFYQKLVESIAQTTVGPPLGLAYIAGVLEKYGYSVGIVDANAQQLSVKKIIDRIIEFKAQVIGITAVTPTIHLAHQIARELKKKNSSISTVIGGIHATVLPEETLQEFPGFDFLVRGEGEFATVELLKALNNNLPLTGVRGLAYRNKGTVVVNEPQSPVEDLDTLPFPARHLLKNSLYRSFESNRMTTLIAMRGCPARCIYCAVHLSAGRTCRKRSPANIIEEIELCQSDYGTRFFGFLDDTFTFDKSWVHGLCEELIQAGLHRRIKWSCLTRVDNVDYQLLSHMKQAGCARVEFGIESGSQRMLDFLKKGITLEQIKEAFSMAKKTGLSTMGFVMLNIPGETKEDIADTKRLLMEIEPDFLQVSFATPYPGTELFKICEKDNLFLSRDWGKYIFLNHQIIKNNFISEDELKRLKQDIQRSFYLRPGYIFKIAAYLFRNPGKLWPMIRAGCKAIGKLFKDRG